MEQISSDLSAALTVFQSNVVSFRQVAADLEALPNTSPPDFVNDAVRDYETQAMRTAAALVWLTKVALRERGHQLELEQAIVIVEQITGVRPHERLVEIERDAEEWRAFHEVTSQQTGDVAAEGVQPR